MKYETIIDKLCDERVVWFRIIDDGYSVGVMECCDYWFDVVLSKEEFSKMIDELIDIKNKLK